MFLEADYVATGHYARIRRGPEGSRLLKGVDGKDQSYVLFTLGQAELSKLLLPVGELPKPEIRKLASQAGLPVADKPDSQEICFIPSDNYREFISERITPRPGDFVNDRGEVLGEHPGIQFFTVGQRRKLGLPGNTGEPLFVVGIDPEADRVVLGRSEQLYRTDLWASRVNWISGESPDGPINVTAKIRYKASVSPATVTPHGDWATVEFDEPQRAITPGQAVVFYRGEEVVGGGYIEAPKGTDKATNGSVEATDSASSVRSESEPVVAGVTSVKGEVV
jgi:tRNA-specific 2-thiouridylase